MRLSTVLALALAIGLATAVAPFASSSPDGLARVADDLGFAGNGHGGDAATDRADEGGGGRAPLADYAFPGIENERVATGVAGFTGALGVFALGAGLTFVIRRRRAWT